MRNGTKPVCYQFRDSGFCSYGTSCRFSHTDPRYKAHHPDGKKVSLPMKRKQFCSRLVAQLVISLCCKRRKRSNNHPTISDKNHDRNWMRFPLFLHGTQTSRTTINEAWRRNSTACATSSLGIGTTTNARKLVKDSKMPWSFDSTAFTELTSLILRIGTSFA